MLYTYEWVDGWIDKQTVKLCCKLHSTRRVYNLDLIKLILKNTTDIIFSWAFMAISATYRGHSAKMSQRHTPQKKVM